MNDCSPGWLHWGAEEGTKWGRAWECGGSALRGGCGCHWQALKEASHYACIYFICTINRELELFGVKYSPSLPLNKISASLCPMPIKGDVFVLLDVITYHPSFLKLNPMLFSFYFLLFFSPLVSLLLLFYF